MKTAQMFEATGIVFGLVRPAVTSPAPPGVDFVHFDETKLDIATQQTYDVSWGPKTKEGYVHE